MSSLGLENVGGRGIFSCKLDADSRWLMRGSCAHRRVHDDYVRGVAEESAVDVLDLRMWSGALSLSFTVKKGLATLSAANAKTSAEEVFGLVWATLRPGEEGDSAKYRLASAFVLGDNVEKVSAACDRACQAPEEATQRNAEVAALGDPDLTQAALAKACADVAFGMLLYCYKSAKPTEGVMLFLNGHNGKTQPVWAGITDLQEQVVQFSKSLRHVRQISRGGGSAADAAAGAGAGAGGSAADAAAAAGGDGDGAGNESELDKRLSALEALCYTLEDKIKALDRRVGDIEDAAAGP